MQEQILQITEDEFYEKYKPQQNHLDNNASWDGCLFETFGSERDYCFELAKKENRVWTIIECDNEDFDVTSEDVEFDEDGDPYIPACLYIISGFHYVNREGFIVTEKPYEQETEIKLNF